MYGLAWPGMCKIPWAETVDVGGRSGYGDGDSGDGDSGIGYGGGTAYGGGGIGSVCGVGICV